MGKEQFFAQKTPDEVMQWEDRKAIDEFRETAKPGRWRFDAVLERKPKTMSQLGYIFAGIIDSIIEECNETRQDGVDSLLQFLIDPDIPKGQAATKNLVKEVCYAIAPTFGENGRRKTLSSMSAMEAGKFIDRLLNIFANFTEIDDPRLK